MGSACLYFCLYVCDNYGTDLDHLTMEVSQLMLSDLVKLAAIDLDVNKG